MRLARLHRRLVIVSALCALLAYADGIGYLWPSGWVAALLLGIGLLWQPGTRLGRRAEQLWLPLAVLLVVRALFTGFVLNQDLVLPVVDLLLLLLCAECLRPLESPNDARLYALVFALLLASTAYRPGLVFALAFLGSTVTLVPALVIGHLQRESRLQNLVPPSRVTGLRAPSLGAAVFVVVFAILVFVAFPRVSRDFPGRQPSAGKPVAGFADAVTLGAHGATIATNPEVVLRVEFDGGEPPPTSALYWRGRSYDRFDGARWTRSRGLRPSAAPQDWYVTRWPGPSLRQTLYSTRLDVRVLPALHPVTSIEAMSTVNPLLDTTGDLLYWGSGDPVYEAVSRPTLPAADSLRAAQGRFVPGGRAFVQLPRLDEAVTRLADSLTVGADNRYDRAAAIRDWFHQEFTYTRQLPATSGEATLEHFLFERRAGHCEYFSTAMVVLLRSVGIEAREVNGFLGGEWNAFGGYLLVTQNQAHSWVEVWFPGFGWVPFDPTPSTSVSGEALSTFRWPGHFLLDGLRHRWKKWVLDYGPERQAALLERLSGDDARSVTGAPDSSPGLPLWIRIAVGLLLAAGLLGLTTRWARGERLRPESRSFERLRRAYQRAGFSPLHEVGPLTLRRQIREADAPAARETQELVDLYLRLRFSPDPDRAQLSRLRAGVGRVTRILATARMRRLLVRKSG